MNDENDIPDTERRRRQAWDAVAAGWEKWRETLQAGTAAVTDRLLEMTEVRAGSRVLDLACGVGEPALTAAQRVGSGGEVVALDQSPGMLALASRRAQDLHLGNMRFINGNGETLAGVYGSFDAVLCRWGLMFFDDLPGALRRIQQVLRPGHRFAAAVWSLPARVPTVNLAISVTNRVLGITPTEDEAPGPFSLSDHERLRRHFIDAGFRQVFLEYMPVALEAPSAQAYMELIQDLFAPVVALLEQQPEERRAQIWAAIRDATANFTLPDGRVRMWNETICICGMR